MKKLLRKGVLFALMFAGLSLLLDSCGNGSGKKKKVEDEAVYTPAAGGGSGGTASGSGNTLETKWITVPAGSFTMGRGTGNTSTRRFYSSFVMCDHEVTVGEYKSVMGVIPAGNSETEMDLPVSCVTWYDAIKYCNALSKKEGLIPAYTIDSNDNSKVYWTGSNGYRLPREDEWEYAASNKGADLYSGTSELSWLEDYCWFIYNSSDRTHKVKSKKPNGLGLYDMSGNVYEWCWEDFADESDCRVVRGGAYHTQSANCATSSRFGIYPFSSYTYLGFRVIRGN